MLKWIETTGRSEEDAIAAALFQLGLDRDDVSVEVIERAKSGFLGFGSNPAKVRVSYEEVDGKARPIHDGFQLEEAPAPVAEEKPAPEAKPVMKEIPQPVKKEEPPAAPVAEETILAAKPGMAAPKHSRPPPPRAQGAPPAGGPPPGGGRGAHRLLPRPPGAGFRGARQPRRREGRPHPGVPHRPDGAYEGPGRAGGFHHQRGQL